MLAQITNTERTILCAAARSRLVGVTAFELFRAWYKTSKQPGKKVAGIHRHMRRMTRQGLLAQAVVMEGTPMVDRFFLITTDGLSVLRSDANRTPATPSFPRLAT